MGRAQFKKELGALHEPLVGQASSLPSEHLAGKGVRGLEAPTAGWKPAPLTSPVHGPNAWSKSQGGFPSVPALRGCSWAWWLWAL